jgi:hypothetical protein
MTSESSLHAQNHMAHVSRTEKFHILNSFNPDPIFRQIDRISGRVEHFTLPRRI